MKIHTCSYYRAQLHEHNIKSPFSQVRLDRQRQHRLTQDDYVMLPIPVAISGCHPQEPEIQSQILYRWSWRFLHVFTVKYRVNLYQGLALRNVHDIYSCKSVKILVIIQELHFT